MKQQKLEADGLASDDAFVASRREMGNVTLARVNSRAEWIWPWLETVWQDARFAIRNLLRQPGFGIAIGLKRQSVHRVRRCSVSAYGWSR